MNVIVAPHPDDEIIGCYKILMESKKCMIIYDGETLPDRREEVTKLKDSFSTYGFGQLFLKSIPSNLMTPENIFYFPDPIYETHPLHRQWGNLGESLARTKMNVIFYTINKLTPYISELNSLQIKEKEELLNKVYPSQKSLWEYEKKYILFEGYCKWIF
jgi:hypothetical protein